MFRRIKLRAGVMAALPCLSAFALALPLGSLGQSAGLPLREPEIIRLAMAGLLLLGLLIAYSERRVRNPRR
jgi:hypothetical protein